MKVVNEVLSAKERQERLEAIVYDPDVVASGSIYEEGITVGVPGKTPICRVVPCVNHRVKAPIGVGLYGLYGQLAMVTYVLRADVYALRGNQTDGSGIDVLAPILEIMKLDMGCHVLAYGYRGAHIAQTGYDEFTLNIESKPVLRAYTSSTPAGGIMTSNRGMDVAITCPGLSSMDVGTLPASFVLLAHSATPSLMAASWKEELKTREKRRVHG